mmetsp:Transcript_12889/g.32591  ORF Transcript_12889/g.32591 Transcript_12889/m.32591 type:complete len:200 (+) Transcript_12889:423-1022(+)
MACARSWRCCSATARCSARCLADMPPAVTRPLCSASSCFSRSFFSFSKRWFSVLSFTHACLRSSSCRFRSPMTLSRSLTSPCSAEARSCMLAIPPSLHRHDLASPLAAALSPAESPAHYLTQWGGPARRGPRQPLPLRSQVRSHSAGSRRVRALLEQQHPGLRGATTRGAEGRCGNSAPLSPQRRSESCTEAERLDVPK